jgi:hypothetical protein
MPKFVIRGAGRLRESSASTLGRKLRRMREEELGGEQNANIATPVVMDSFTQPETVTMTVLNAAEAQLKPRG